MAAIVLAAGKSHRMGAANKLLIKFNEHPMIEHVVKTLNESCLDEIIVVTGFEAGDHPTHDIDPAHEIGMVTFRVRRGRLAGAEGRSTPDHDLQNFKELLTVLRRIYKVPT